MAASNPESSQELDFPPVRVDHSIEKLDLNSLIMRSNTRPSPQEATALDESTYEVVGMSDSEVVGMSDSIYETSDDEGHTASVASTADVSTFDDEEDDDFAQYTDDRPLPLETSTIEPTDDHVPNTGDIDDSALTEGPYMGQSESLTEIRMEEEQQVGQGLTKAWAITKEFTSSQTAEGVLKPYNCLDMRLTVRASLSDFYMPARNAFKILYVGNIADWARVDIESCISKALDASPGPSRSIMRHGQMEPYGPVLSSDHCTAIKRLDDTAKTSDVLVTFDDGMGLTFGTSRKYSSVQAARLPDLVVFWYPHPRIPASEIANFPAACEAFGRHQIPCLHVAEDRRFHHHSLEPVGNSKTMQLCVEGKNDDCEEFVLRENIPIDLYTLQNLDSSQLNRHLVALDSRIPSPKPTSQFKPWGLPSFSTYFNKAIRSGRGTVFNFALILGLLTVMLSSCYILLPSMSLTQTKSLPAQREIVSTLCGSPGPPITILAQPSSTSTPSVSADPTSSTPSALSVVFPLHKSPSRRILKKQTEQSIFYDVRMTGEHEFTLSPAKDFVDRKSKPQLQIQVTKDSEKVPIRYTRTTDGGYVVELEQEYQVGLFNVTIATHSKPFKMQQWFTVSMGHNKTLVGQFMDMFNRDVAAKQESLKKMSSFLSENAKAALSRAETNINGLKKQAHLPNTNLAGGMRETRKEVQRQIESGVHLIQEASSETWQGLRKVTAPVRTSNAALRARKNAFQIRCRFEEAVGLSDATQEGKKTRACKHAGR
ncbi:hypothetical protein DM02DRAFT_367095 [Periconia macrospinosa]|uniref:Uncharacterized protein n=1 Tax=Periconia macrospinosa TaxID=97972 RepID=A0A2V1DSH8_9PLEO|nr:hypothetical protein DM02DRAFT_367095 [Periconia macrospinosa]